MKKILCLTVLALTFSAGSISAQTHVGGDGWFPAYADSFQTEKFQADSFQTAQPMKFSLGRPAAPAQSAGEGGPPDTFLIIIPEFHYTKVDALTTIKNGNYLKMSGGETTGGALTMIARRQINDTWGAGLLYQYANLEYEGGILVPGDPVLGAHFTGDTDQKAQTHMIGLLNDFNFKEYGRLTFIAAHCWDFYSGDETMYHPIIYPTGRDTRSLDDQTSTILSLKLWYELDFPINDHWTATPYLGYRYMYATASDMNDFNGPRGATSDLHVWHHMGAVGGKLKFKSDLTTFTARLGYSRRFRSDNIPGYAGRFAEQGAAHLGYYVNYDRDHITYGLGVNHVFPEKGFILGVNYDGMNGGHVSSHMGTVTVGFMF